MTSNDSTAIPQIVENLPLDVGHERRGVDEIQAGLVFDARARLMTLV
jgi:hypothetical protein